MTVTVYENLHEAKRYRLNSPVVIQVGFMNSESAESIVIFVHRITYARWTVSMFTAAFDAL